MSSKYTHIMTSCNNSYIHIKNRKYFNKTFYFGMVLYQRVLTTIVFRTITSISFSYFPGIDLTSYVTLLLSGVCISESIFLLWCLHHKKLHSSMPFSYCLMHFYWQNDLIKNLQGLEVVKIYWRTSRVFLYNLVFFLQTIYVFCICIIWFLFYLFTWFVQPIFQIFRVWFSF